MSAALRSVGLLDVLFNYVSGEGGKVLVPAVEVSL